MCKVPVVAAANKRPPLRQLYSLDSFADGGTSRPPTYTILLSALVFFMTLVLSEQFCRFVLSQVTHWHPVLEVETHRQILARHIGVDTFACCIVFWMGWQSRHLHNDLFKSLKGVSGSMPKAAYPNRLFTYQASGFRVALLFFVYQVKNLMDSIMWKDGYEYIFHHIFSLFTAWGAMVPGCGHYYALFFFGMCELSTAAVCVLANFDADQGVPELGEAFPMTKIAIGVVFVVLFITCRCVLWPIYSFYFSRDVLLALKDKEALQLSATRTRWMKFFLVSLSGLSVLQVAWLGQIFVVAKEEFIKVGLL